MGNSLKRKKEKSQKLLGLKGGEALKAKVEGFHILVLRTLLAPSESSVYGNGNGGY